MLILNVRNISLNICTFFHCKWIWKITFLFWRTREDLKMIINIYDFNQYRHMRKTLKGEYLQISTLWPRLTEPICVLWINYRLTLSLLDWRLLILVTVHSSAIRVGLPLFFWPGTPVQDKMCAWQPCLHLKNQNGLLQILLKKNLSNILP